MLLAIDTALHACSAALIDGDRVVASRFEVIGRGHAERLVPMIAELLAETGTARADEILVDVGPGSFTGLRVGIAAARAFGLAWGARVQGCLSTAVVAGGIEVGAPLLVALDASRGEVYAQLFDGTKAVGDPEALAPEAAAAVASARGAALAGSGAALVAAHAPELALIDHPWPRAADMRLLPVAQRSLPPRPVYIRAPDARLPS
jgi:tRNA threonylcarbamoyl adenosine modification protein YeaZ